MTQDTLRNSPFDELLKLEELDREATYRQSGKEKNIYHVTVLLKLFAVKCRDYYSFLLKTSKFMLLIAICFYTNERIFIAVIVSFPSYLKLSKLLHKAFSTLGSRFVT